MKKFKKIICCPINKDELAFNPTSNIFVSSKGIQYPVIDGKPILINDNTSIFKQQEIIEGFESGKTKKSNGIISNILNNLIKIKPSINLNFVSHKNYQNIFENISSNENMKILIIGAGSFDGNGLNTNSYNNLTFIKSDIFISKNIDIVCDAHNLPFFDETIDGVIIQAVLEHVINPTICVAEIHRVLKHTGWVYAETPFMQQVHLGRFDFTRFTHLGHRNLFKQFKEIKSGSVCGPASALTWSIKYFLRSFFKASILQTFFEFISTFFYFWIKYLDYFLINKIGSYDSAGAYFFYGKKSNTIISDKEIINSYKGLIV